MRRYHAILLGHMGSSLEQKRIGKLLSFFGVSWRDLTVTDFLAMKESTVEGTVLRRMLDASDWDRFTREAANVFRERYADAVSFVRDVHFGIGVKGGSNA